MNTKPTPSDPGTGGFCRRTRREFLWEAGGGFTGLALTGLLGLDKFFANTATAAPAAFANPLAPKQPHVAGKARSVIFLCPSRKPLRPHSIWAKARLMPP